MRKQIDIPRSIQKRRLTYKMTAELILSNILDNSIWILFLGATFLALCNKNNYIKHGLTFPIIAVTIGMWIIVGLYFINKLIAVDGLTQDENRKRIIEIVKNKFPKLAMNGTGQSIIRFKKEIGIFNWGREITIIFNKNEFFINYTTFGRYHIKSPFHALTNYLILARLLRQFSKNNSL